MKCYGMFYLVNVSMINVITKKLLCILFIYFLKKDVTSTSPSTSTTATPTATTTATSITTTITTTSNYY